MKTIFIGVGHGGSDPGACNGARRESDDNLRLAQAVAAEITVQGHKAVLSRTADVAMTPEQRRQAAIAAGADIGPDILPAILVNLVNSGFVSVYNSGGTIYVACGTVPNGFISLTLSLQQTMTA